MSLEGPVSKYKFSKYVAYVLSIALAVIFILNWKDLVPVAWPIILLFVFTLIFNGGLGGKTIRERLPFYIALMGFVGFVAIAFLSMM